MSFKKGPVFTAAGRALHARALAGATLTFTKMEMGDGSRGSATIENMTALAHTVASVGISGLRHSGNFAVISGIFSNADISEGFNWNEIGLFAADPDYPDDRSRDILYCYQDAEGDADYIAASDSELITKRVSIAAIVSNATAVTAVFDPVARAVDVTFDNTATGMEAEDVQAAIEELVVMMESAGNAEAVLAEAEKIARGLVAHNLLVDGGFEMGAAHWQNWTESYYSFARSNVELVHGYYSLKLTTVGENTTGTFYGPFQQFFALARAGHVMYISAKVKAPSGTRPAIALGYGGTDQSNHKQAITANGEWQTISRRIALTAGTYPTTFYIGLDGNFSSGVELFFDDAMVVDLTDVFGAGSEPTKEWCDQHIEYFNTAAAINELQTLALHAALEATVTT